MSDFNKRKDIRTEIHKNGLFNHFSKNYKNIFFPILFLKFEQYFFFVQYCSKNSNNIFFLSNIVLKTSQPAGPTAGLCLLRRNLNKIKIIVKNYYLVIYCLMFSKSSKRLFFKFRGVFAFKTL